jgi:FtsZ-binding cell division protein ZapB
MKTTRILNCPFTVEELKEIGIELALENQKKERLEDDKKKSQSQYKSEIDACDARIKSLAQKLARGSEERTIKCDVLFNTPAEGKKTITRGDTGEVVQVLDMTESELTDLFINNLGARKEENEFVFRDKSRAKMCGRAEFEKLKKDCGDKVQEIFEKIGDGYTEEALVDDKPEKVELCLVVFELDNETRKDVFEVYRFAELPDQEEDGKEDVRPQLPAPIDVEAEDDPAAEATATHEDKPEETTEVKRPVETVNPIHVGKLDVENSPEVRFEVGKEYEIGGKIFECEHETEGK